MTSEDQYEFVLNRPQTNGSDNFDFQLEKSQFKNKESNSRIFDNPSMASSLNLTLELNKLSYEKSDEDKQPFEF